MRSQPRTEWPGLGKCVSLAASIGGPRQHRRGFLSTILLLDLDLGDKERRRCRRYGNAARLGAAITVEYFGLVRCRRDLSETRKRCAHDIDAAHQLIRPAIGVDAIDHQRNDRERLQAAPLR